MPPSKRSPSHRSLAQPNFLPMTRQEMDRLGWDGLDVLLVSGDAYVDHPSFGTALLGRWLVEHGYRVGVAAQPRWETAEDVARLGRPLLFAGVSAGAMDSMLAHYTAFRKKRHDDAYTPGGKAGARPNRACVVYANLVKRAFPGLPVVLGGIEASLRRFAHYDFWTDKIRRSILLDAKADLLLYGMAETGILEVARRLEAGEPLAGVAGSVWAVKAGIAEEGGAPVNRAGARDAGARAERTAASPPEEIGQAEILLLPSQKEIEADPVKLMPATLAVERQVHQNKAYAMQRSGDRLVVAAPPGPQLAGATLDRLYALPFTRAAHPSYEEPIPAEEMIFSSITTHRGCGGGCSFCTLALHQGRRIRSRTKPSILDEARRLAEHEDFNGAISDVGGPSANMWNARCLEEEGKCQRSSCLTPAVCPKLEANQGGHIELLRDVRRTPGVKHVRVASGVRMDLLRREPEALAAYVREFTGGQFKVAPEHVCANVLKLMRKPGLSVFEEFLSVFERESKRCGKEQYVIPYLMSGFPGCSDEDMRRLAGWLKARGWRPKQAQSFIPLPGTVASAMFFAGVDEKLRPIFVARTDAERLRQHGILIPETGARPGGRGAKGAESEGRGRADGSDSPNRKFGRPSRPRHAAEDEERDARQRAERRQEPRNEGSKRSRPAREQEHNGKRSDDGRAVARGKRSGKPR